MNNDKTAVSHLLLLAFSDTCRSHTMSNQAAFRIHGPPKHPSWNPSQRFWEYLLHGLVLSKYLWNPLQQSPAISILTQVRLWKLQILLMLRGLGTLYVESFALKSTEYLFWSLRTRDSTLSYLNWKHRTPLTLSSIPYLPNEHLLRPGSALGDIFLRPAKL